MRANLGAFGDDYDGRRMRALINELERLFAQIRINDQVITGSGYSSGGVTISTNGNIQAAGDLTIDGITTLTGNVVLTSIDVGGGYGATGVTISSAGNISLDGILTSSNATDASSSITGSVILAGGVGIAKKLYVGGTLNVTGHTTLEGVTSTGATGTGKLVYDGSPTLVTPTLGVATATSLNKVAITAPATAATITIVDGKTFTSSNTVTLTATDGSTLAIGTGGTLGSAAYTATTAYDAAGTAASAVSTHAALQTGIHGISITASKTFAALNTLTLSGTDGSTLAIGTGGTLGTAAYTASGDYLPVGGTAANASQLLGATWASPGAIGSGSANTGAFSTLRIGAGTTITKYLSATATWNPGNLSAIGWGVSVSNTSTTVTVTGAALGDIALASFSLDLSGLTLSAYVSATDTVTCVLTNATASAVNLAEGTLRASVLQH